MYPGWLTFDGREVVNNHRTETYARNAGIRGLVPCSHCNGIYAADGLTYKLPARDIPHPPWWDGSRDAKQFFGLYGVTLSGADNSTRQVTITESLGDGGYLSRIRHSTRVLILSGVALAADDTALGFGLSWLRSLDTTPSCTAKSIGVYEACPCACNPDCGDQDCLDQCVRTYQRQFREARILSGPNVLRRRAVSGGYMAQLEIQFGCGDPAAYSPSYPVYGFMTLGGLIND